MKPYWVLVFGFVLLLIFVIVLRMPSRRLGPGGTRRHLIGPGGMQHLLGPGGTQHLFEGFQSTPRFTMFGVDWCPHCVKAKPLFESLGSTVTIGGQAVELRHVNPEQEKEAAKGYQIEGYPACYFEKDGRKVKYAGPRTAAGFQDFLTQELSS